MPPTAMKRPLGWMRALATAAVIVAIAVIVAAAPLISPMAAADTGVTVTNRFGSALPATGADSTPLLVAAGIAGVLILGGVILMIVLRRRRRS